MSIVLPALLLGVTAGLRSAMPLAALAWAVALGWLPVAGTWAALLAHPIARYLFTLGAVGELVVDKLPRTPSRTAPPLFIGRVLSGALAGAVLGTVGGSVLRGLVTGAVGGVIGTLGGYAARMRLARAFGRDLPAALLEDVAAIGLAIAIVAAAR